MIQALLHQRLDSSAFVAYLRLSGGGQVVREPYAHWWCPCPRARHVVKALFPCILGTGIYGAGDLESWMARHNQAHCLYKLHHILGDASARAPWLLLHH